MSGLKMAKADPEEFERVMSFVIVMEALFESRSIFSHEEDWRDWPDDDEDKKTLLDIEKEVKEEDGTDWNGDADNRLILYEFIKRKWKQANFSGSFGRIIMDAEVLIDNACDPDLDYLEFKPEILAAMKEYEEKEEMMEAARKQLMNELWHKSTDNPGNQHPYPVINPDTQEMAYAYYNQRLGWWEFDRDYNPGCNMLWLDIEKILPNMKGDEK